MSNPQSEQAKHAESEGRIFLKLILAYDGTAYAGWQVQKTGLAVQEKLQAALTKLFPHAGPVQGSSRTDAGVHALGMVAHVGIPLREMRMAIGKVALAVNAFLPEDIRVTSACRCSETFHARFDAVGKQYRYLVWNHRAMNPLLRHLAWQVPKPLDIGVMRSTAKLFLGKHDFASFAGVRDYKMRSTVRTVTRCDLKRSGALLTFVIEGDGFLYKMCRTLVGTIVQAGWGKFAPAEVQQMLARKDRRVAGMTAPAHGLVLWKVYYAKSRSKKRRGAATISEASGRDGVLK